MLWVYGHYKYFTRSVWVSTLDVRRQILAFKVGPRADRVKYITGTSEQHTLKLNEPSHLDSTISTISAIYTSLRLSLLGALAMCVSLQHVHVDGCSKKIENIYLFTTNTPDIYNRSMKKVIFV